MRSVIPESSLVTPRSSRFRFFISSEMAISWTGSGRPVTVLVAMAGRV